MDQLEVAPPTTPGAPRGGQRRVRVQIRKVNPWSVLRFSLLFYFCLMLVALLGLAILWGILSAAGVLDSVAELLTDVGFGDRQGNFQFDTGYIFRTLFLIGLISTILWAAFTLVVAFLYNLIADLVGGIEVTMIERR